MREKEAFSNFVSLGSSCHTAASMSKYGLRSWSGPFDWLITGSLKWVLHYMENNFEDFLQKEDLECFKGDPKKFISKKSGFIFMHDQEYPFREKYEELMVKYQKRINRFLNEIKKPTCFLRYMTTSEDNKYIKENVDFINYIIKKTNKQNEIIFFVKDTSVELQSSPFKLYVVPEKLEKSTKSLHDSLRCIFDNIDEFHEYCALKYDSETMMKNLQYDRSKETNAKNSE